MPPMGMYHTQQVDMFTPIPFHNSIMECKVFIHVIIIAYEPEIDTISFHHVRTARHNSLNFAWQAHSKPGLQFHSERTSDSDRYHTP